MIEPFIIARQRFDYIDCVWVTLVDEHGQVGRAETCGVDYLGESVESICAQLDHVRPQVEAGIDREALQQLLPAGGARNGLDCALWDLHYRRSGQSAWQLSGLQEADSTGTAYTIGVVGAAHAVLLARKFQHYRTLKIKADDSGSLATIEAVRAARPDARIIIDANQSWSWQTFETLEPRLIDLDVALLEQPFAVNGDSGLRAYHGPLQIAADESVQSSADLEKLQGLYDVINIKLDKTGGLTEALRLARRAQELGFALMVGNMCGSSLAMAPGYVLAQLCDYVDLDGPLLQTEDVEPALLYHRGNIRTAPGGGVWAGL